ncbi:MAG: hypothetical protein GMKNLPBB_01410 [Myxococcota bacterium]|nr:hypothetical protein [Myxococcota bacterium]
MVGAHLANSSDRPDTGAVAAAGSEGIIVATVAHHRLAISMPGLIGSGVGTTNIGRTARSTAWHRPKRGTERRCLSRSQSGRGSNSTRRLRSAAGASAVTRDCRSSTSRFVCAAPPEPQTREISSLVKDQAAMPARVHRSRGVLHANDTRREARKPPDNLLGHNRRFKPIQMGRPFL